MGGSHASRHLNRAIKNAFKHLEDRMTVAELIEKLKQFDPELPVFSREDYFGYPDREFHSVDLGLTTDNDRVVLID